MEGVKRYLEKKRCTELVKVLNLRRVRSNERHGGFSRGLVILPESNIPIDAIRIAVAPFWI
jgi:hypothetical protein